MTRQHALHLRAFIEQTATTLSDEEALTGIELFPMWVTNKWYEVDERIRYGETLYRCVIAHTSQSNWTPDITPALWTEVAPPGEIPVWKQPTGSQDAYMTGDKVHYPTAEDAVYISIVDNNVWQPDTYGWELVE